MLHPTPFSIKITFSISRHVGGWHSWVFSDFQEVAGYQTYREGWRGRVKENWVLGRSRSPPHSRPGSRRNRSRRSLSRLFNNLRVPYLLNYAACFIFKRWRFVVANWSELVILYLIILVIKNIYLHIFLNYIFSFLI